MYLIWGELQINVFVCTEETGGEYQIVYNRMINQKTWNEKREVHKGSVTRYSPVYVPGVRKTTDVS